MRLKNFPHFREAFNLLIVSVVDNVCRCLQLGAGVAVDLEWSSSEVDELLETHEKCVGRIVLSYLKMNGCCDSATEDHARAIAIVAESSLYSVLDLDWYKQIQAG